MLNLLSAYSLDEAREFLRCVCVCAGNQQLDRRSVVFKKALGFWAGNPLTQARTFTSRTDGGLVLRLCWFLSCSKTFGTYEIKQYNCGKRAEAEQLMQAAAALTAAAAAPKADENSIAQQAALVRSTC